MGHETAPGQVECGLGSLYSLAADHTVKKHVDKVDISNGLAWSLNNSVLYYVDSLPRKVYAFDFDLATGSLCKLDMLFVLSLGLMLTIFIVISALILLVGRQEGRLACRKPSVGMLMVVDLSGACLKSHH